MIGRIRLNDYLMGPRIRPGGESIRLGSPGRARAGLGLLSGRQPVRPGRLATALAIAAALVAAAVPGHAQNGDVHRDRLEWFIPLIGGTWLAEGEVPGAGVYTAERRYEWALDSTFVAVTHTMRFATGPTIEERMMIGWDAVDQRIHVWSFASDGSYSDGYEVSGQDSRRWTAEGRTVGGRGGEWRITTFVYEENAMSMLIEVRAGRDYESALTMAFHRR